MSSLSWVECPILVARRDTLDFKKHLFPQKGKGWVCITHRCQHLAQGTLKEKISAIIERKRNLMNTVVQEDNADMIKSFDRSKLLELRGDLAPY